MSGAVAIKTRPPKIAVKQSQKVAASVETQTKVATLVTVKQSLELAQTLLYSAFSTIAYLRGLFDNDCFRDQFDSLVDDFLPFQQFATGNVPPDPNIKKKKRRQGLKLNLLQRGKDERVDGILDILEIGIFDALKNNAIQAVQLNIAASPNAPRSTVESWTLSVNYNDHLSKAKGTIDTLTLSNPENEQLTVKNTRNNLQHLIKKINSACAGLLVVRGRKTLNIDIHYTESTRLDYEAPGFSTWDDRCFFPSDNGWTREVHPVGSIDMGCHQMSIKLAGISSDDDVESIPDDLEYGTEIHGQDEIDMTIDLPIESPEHKEHGPDADAEKKPVDLNTSPHKSGAQGAHTKPLRSQLGSSGILPEERSLSIRSQGPASEPFTQSTTQGEAQTTARKLDAMLTGTPDFNNDGETQSYQQKDVAPYRLDQSTAQKRTRDDRLEPSSGIPRGGVKRLRTSRAVRGNFRVGYFTPSP